MIYFTERPVGFSQISGGLSGVHTDVHLGNSQGDTRLSRLPWNSEEVKAQLACRYYVDECALSDLLRVGGSAPRRIFRFFTLNRQAMKSVFRGLQFNRVAQVAFSTPVCANSFKFRNQQGFLRPVFLPIC